jgi:hypothetical protein
MIDKQNAINPTSSAYTYYIKTTLSAFAKLRKGLLFSSRVCLLSLRPHGTIRLLLNGLSWHLIFGYFSKICRKNSSSLTLYQLMWRIWLAHNNASKWQMGFNWVFKGLKSGKNNEYFTRRLMYIWYLNQFFLEWETVQTKFAKTIETHFMFNKHLPKAMPCMRYGKIWYCQTGHTSQYNMAHAHSMLDNYGYRHTLIICNITFPRQQWLREHPSMLRV